MHATIRYNVLRFCLLVVVGAVCYLLGARRLPLVFLTFFISLPLSYVLLARWRRAMIDEFASGQARKYNPVRAVNDRIEAANAREDAAVDEAERESLPSAGTDEERREPPSP